MNSELWKVRILRRTPFEFKTVRVGQRSGRLAQSAPRQQVYLAVLTLAICSEGERLKQERAKDQAR